MNFFCILGDCGNTYCHHCYPVINCSKSHTYCNTHGTCKEIMKGTQCETILVTGCAGFIGSHVCENLLKEDYNVIGIDILNTYYDVDIKLNNLSLLESHPNFLFLKEDICNTQVISRYKPDKIIHLASMAGVRYSIENPSLYEKTNIGGFIHIMEESIKNKVKLIVYASSSSVYGLNKKVPFSETDPIQTCNSPYACSKLAMEIFAKTYYQLYQLPNIGLRFFTVYGPRGRPDMAPYKFLNAIKNETSFKKFGDGSTSRDYTYIDDIVSGIIGALHYDQSNYEILNLGNDETVTLSQMIETIESVLAKKAEIDRQPNQQGDVPQTWADIEKARKLLKYNPKTKFRDGIIKFNISKRL